MLRRRQKLEICQRQGLALMCCCGEYTLRVTGWVFETIH